MKRILLPLAAACLARAVHAQEPVPDFDKLRTPASPAFVVLDVSPTAIQRPTQPSTLAFALLQGLSIDKPQSAAGNFSLEVAPYWLVSHPTLTLQRYYNGSWSENLIRTTTFSVARIATDGDSTSSDISAGVRAMLWQGGTARNTQCIARVQAAATAVSRKVAQIVVDSITRNSALAQNAVRLEQIRSTSYSAALESLPLEEKKALTSEVKECTASLSARNGFMLDGAGAAAWRFTNGAAASGQLVRGSVWLTPSYIQNNMSFVGVMRYGWSGPAADSSFQALDTGLRTVYAWDRFAASFEGLVRTASGDTRGMLYRVGGAVDVRLAGDLWLTTSFAKNYQGDQRGSLIAAANFQWNIGDRSVRPDLK